MLTEWDVVDAVCQELKSRGYQIKAARGPTERGDDIVALKHAPNPFQLSIEAKGQGSSRADSSRYGQPFTGAQVRNHVARALYKAAQVLSRTADGTETRAGIALPDTSTHRTTVRAIQPILDQLGIAVFWVNARDSVQIESTWKV